MSDLDLGSSKSDALERSLRYYRTGKPCKWGHVASRRTSDSHCVDCVAEYIAKNKERINENYKVYYQKNRNELLAKKKKYRKNNRHVSRKYEQENRLKILEGKKERCRKSPETKLSKNMRSALHNSLEHGKAIGAFRHVDYSLDELKVHLERQFNKGMNWGNQGEWHIDHVMPVSSFNITGPDCREFKACWSLSNLRPLWAKENLEKGSKVEYLI